MRSGAAGFLGVTTTGHSVQDLHGPSDRVFDVGQGAGMLRGARAGTGRGGRGRRVVQGSGVGGVEWGGRGCGGDSAVDVGVEGAEGRRGHLLGLLGFHAGWG